MSEERFRRNINDKVSLPCHALRHLSGRHCKTISASIYLIGLGLVLAWPAKARVPDCVLWPGGIACGGELLDAEPAAEPQQQPPLVDQGGNLCQLVADAAKANGLPVEFFVRLIWQESRFKAEAIGPVTRSGAHALGIAQFMPVTAAERQLVDPFDPSKALPKSAELLRDLHAEFGNLGLAAAAYNAGQQRVRDWLDGKRRLPGQTQAYVRAITGRPAQEWAGPGAAQLALAVPQSTPCVDMARFADLARSRVAGIAIERAGIPAPPVENPTADERPSLVKDHPRPTDHLSVTADNPPPEHSGLGSENPAAAESPPFAAERPRAPVEAPSLVVENPPPPETKPPVAGRNAPAPAKRQGFAWKDPALVHRSGQERDPRPTHKVVQPRLTKNQTFGNYPGVTNKMLTPISRLGLTKKVPSIESRPDLARHPEFENKIAKAPSYPVLVLKSPTVPNPPGMAKKGVSLVPINVTLTGKRTLDKKEAVLPNNPVPAEKNRAAPTKKEANPTWGVQLVGDKSELKALAAYRELRKKYAAILSPYKPTVLHTPNGPKGAVWHRVRVGTDTREAAQQVCARLRAAGGSCLVQRN
jgi:hypothetical protein